MKPVLIALIAVLSSLYARACTLSDPLFRILIEYDSTSHGQELRVGFSRPNDSTATTTFSTQNLDSINFEVLRIVDSVIFMISDPAQTPIVIPFCADYLGHIHFSSSLHGSNMEPDLWLETSSGRFFTSITQGIFETETGLFADQVFIGEFQNFSQEVGQFSVSIEGHLPEPNFTAYAFLVFALIAKHRGRRN